MNGSRLCISKKWVTSVNCEQARSLLSAYRELKDGSFDSTELDVHLEGCASCRQTLARDMFIGERIHTLPEIEPPPEMRDRLMRALAHEHTQFLSKASPGSVPTPEFLKPYLREHAQATQISNHLSAFSTAETGPLPIISAKRRRRARSHMSQFAVLGLAAMFLMVLMMGGITSLLLLAHDNTAHLASSNTNSAALTFTEIQKGTYATATPYQHVASAVANHDSIYYTAYSDDTSAAWMLLQLNRATKVSTPLLEQPADQPMIVLESTPQWLIWLQYEQPITRPHNNVPNTDMLPWSLRILSLTQVAQSSIPITPTVLLKGTYDRSTVPSWVNTPIQGIWLTQSVLLVATVDANGTSHLLEYQLNLAGKSAVSEIARTNGGHILTSPTATSDANAIYWADEWMPDTGILSSNIMMQQEIMTNGPVAISHRHGRRIGYATQTTQQGTFRTDGMSFHPQIADNMLFWLSTASASNSQTGTPAASPTPLVATPQLSTTLIPRTEPGIYAPAYDSTERGQVFGQSLDSYTVTPPTSLNNSGTAYALQVGTDFALWQTDKGYEMYDVPTLNDVTTGTTLNDAAFLAVNGDSAVWLPTTTTNATSNPPGQGVVQPVNFFAFNWPK